MCLTRLLAYSCREKQLDVSHTASLAPERKGTNEVSVNGLDSVVDAILRSNLLSEQLRLVDLLDVLRCRLESLGEVVLGELADA